MHARTILTLLVCTASTVAAAKDPLELVRARHPAGPTPASLAPGPGEPAAPDTAERSEPSLSDITPNLVYLERTLDVSISSDDTQWTDAAEVDFGADITVNSVHVASPSGLLVNVTVGADARLGARDVVVREAGAELVYAGAFRVEAPLALSSLQGTAAAGSVLVGSLTQRDLSTPLDAPDLRMVASDPGLVPEIQWSRLYGLDFFLAIDVPTAAGTYDLAVLTGPEGAEVRSLAPDALEIVARQPRLLTVGAPTAGTIDVPYVSALYSFTPPAAPKRTTFSVTSPDPDASPMFFLLPTSGRFAEAIGYQSRIRIDTDTAEPLYVVVWDGSGNAGYDYQLDVTVEFPPPPETEPNDTCDQANAITAASGVAASLPDETDVDWFKVTAGADDVGKSVHVVTLPGEEGTDTVVEVFEADCTTSLGGPSDDTNLHEDHRSAPLPAAGEYLVKVSHSADAHSGSEYDIVVTLE